MKKTILAVLSVFVSWSIINYAVHGIVLTDAYRETAQLWRPMTEMKVGLMYLTVFISSLVFVLIYQRFVSKKSTATAVQYGLLFGLGAGMTMGYGSYSVMPVPYAMAFTWFLEKFVAAAVAGLLLGLIVKE